MRTLLSVALNPGASEIMYEHIGGVLCNITQHELGRQLLAEADLAGVRAVVQMLSARSAVRRTGAAAAVKNMVMSAKADGWLEQLLASQDLLEKLLVRQCSGWRRPLVYWLCCLKVTALSRESSGTAV